MELQVKLGDRLRALRLAKSMTRNELAAKAGLGSRAITNLENGRGSTVETLIRVLKVVDAAGWIESLAPTPTISPMAMLHSPTPPRRVRRSRNTPV